MRAVTSDEVMQIAGGLTKKASPALRTMLKKTSRRGAGVDMLPPVTVTGYPTSGYGNTWGPPTSGTYPVSTPPGGGGGGSGDPPSTTQAAATKAEENYSFATVGMEQVDYSYIFHWENSISPLLVDVPGSKSGVTIAYGVDLKNQTPTTLAGDVLAGYLSQSDEKLLAGLTGENVIGATAQAELSNSGLALYPGHSNWYELPSATTSTLMQQQLAESVYGGIMQQVNTDFANTTEFDGAGGPFAGERDYATYLPSNTATALTDVSIWWGANNMEHSLDSGVFWYDLTHYDWSASISALETQAQHYATTSNAYKRMMGDAGKITQDIGSGKLVDGLPAHG